MVYIIFGSQSYSIQFRYKKIAKDFLGEIDDINYVKIDYNELSFDEIIEEVISFPLGYDKRVVVVNNATFLLKETKALKEDKSYQTFVSYIKNIDDSVVLILALTESNIDTKSEIYNLVNVKGNILALNDVSDAEWVNYVEAYIKKNNGSIDRNALFELAKRTSGNVALLRNTVDTLLLYNPHISMKEINLMVEKPLEENVFLIYNNLISNHSDMALKTYRDLIAQNVEPVTIISTLAKQFRLLYEIKYLVKQRKNNSEIAKILGIKESRAGVISRQIFSLEEYRLREILDNLYILDLEIKSGTISDRYYALEMFIITFNKDK